MKTHKVKSENPETRVIETWCKRQVDAVLATRSLPEVSCVACRDAFARYLRDLPDGLRHVEEAEP